MNGKLLSKVLGVFLLIFVPVFFVVNGYPQKKDTPEILFFYSPQCYHCLKVKNEVLPQLLAKAEGAVSVKFLDIAEISNYELLLELEEKFPKVGEGDRPKIFVGNVILAGERAIKEKLIDKIREVSGSFPAAAISSANPRKFSKLLLERFESFSAFPVIAAGFLDGLNPCAFAVIVFFISFLMLMGYKRKEIFAVGSAFVSAVFITYLLLGLGILRALQRLAVFYPLAKGVNLLIGTAALILAFLNFRDFHIYKKTASLKETKLKLSLKAHGFIHRIINKYFRKDEESRGRPLLLLFSLSFFAGVLIAICTAACTGQVYLPTIVFMLSVPSLKLKAFFYLLIYNLTYILPLAVIFGVSLLGFTSEKLASLAREKFGIMKILLGVLFLILGVVLISYA